jgi:hypothetical protein
VVNCRSSVVKPSDLTVAVYINYFKNGQIESVITASYYSNSDVITTATKAYHYAILSPGLERSEPLS